MLSMVISTSEGTIRLSRDRLSVKRGNAYAYLTSQEYAWLPEYYKFGESLTIVSKGGTVTLDPYITGALVSIIVGNSRRLM